MLRRVSIGAAITLLSFAFPFASSSPAGATVSSTIADGCSSAPAAIWGGAKGALLAGAVPLAGSTMSTAPALVALDGGAAGSGVATGALTLVADGVGGAAAGTAGAVGALGGATVAAGVALSAGTVTAAIVTGLTAFCASSIAMNAIFGERSNLVAAPAGYDGSLQNRVSCSPFSGLNVSNAFCYVVPIPSIASPVRLFSWDRNLAAGVVVPSGWVAESPGVIGSSAGQIPAATNLSGSTAVVQVICQSTQGPSCGVLPGEGIRFSGNGNAYSPVSVKVLLDVNLSRQGLQSYLNSTSTCFASTDGFTTGTVVTHTSTSDSVFAGDQVDPELPACDPGQVPRSLEVVRKIPGASDVNVISWLNPYNPITGNKVTLKCFTTSSCPLYDPAPGNPAAPVEVGGPGGQQITKLQAAETIKGDVQGFLNNASATELGTGTVPATSVAPATVPVAHDETVPAGDAAAAGGPAGTGGGGDITPAVSGAPGSMSSCITDRTASQLGGVTFNPITWVKAIISFVWVPMWCLVLWIFWPTLGWDGEFSRFKSWWDSSTVLAPLRAITSFTASAGSCSSMHLGTLHVGGQSVDLEDVDVGGCDYAVVRTLWNIMLGLGALGMAYDLVQSVSSFDKRRNMIGAK